MPALPIRLLAVLLDSVFFPVLYHGRILRLCIISITMNFISSWLWKNAHIMSIFEEITKRLCHISRSYLMVITSFLPACFRKNFMLTLCLFQILLSPTHFSCWQFLTVLYMFVGSPRLEIQQIWNRSWFPHPLLMWTTLIYNKAVLPSVAGEGGKQLVWWKICPNSWRRGSSDMI